MTKPDREQAILEVKASLIANIDKLKAYNPREQPLILAIRNMMQSHSNIVTYLDSQQCYPYPISDYVPKT